MADNVFEHFVRFATDAYGLERSLRMVQAIASVLAAYPLLLSLLLTTLNRRHGAGSSPVATDLARPQATLQQLRGSMGLARRFFRVFRFLDNFSAAYKLYAASTTDGAALEQWLDAASRSTNGMYLLLETATLPDALGIADLAAWGPERARRLNVEANRFWFFALVCGAAATVVRLVKSYAYTPVPESGEGYGLQAQKGSDDDKGAKSGTKTAHSRGSASGEKAVDEAVDAKRASKLRKEQRDARLHETKTRRRALMRRLAADLLDLFVPGVIVGWTPVEPGTVAVAMTGSTILTGMEVWERCALPRN